MRKSRLSKYKQLKLIEFFLGRNYSKNCIQNCEGKSEDSQPIIFTD